MSTGDTITSGSARGYKPTSGEEARRLRPKPFIPKRPPPMESVYTEDDYDANGNLKVLRKIPEGPRLEERRNVMAMGATSRKEYFQSPAMPATPKEDDGAAVDVVPPSSSSASVRPPPGLRRKGYSDDDSEDSDSEAMKRRQGKQKASGSSSSQSQSQPPVVSDISSKEAYSGLPGKPDVFAPPATKHRLGKNKFDVQTPPKMCDREEQYLAVVRTIENRHPDEDRLLQHYALQYVARREGRYNPIEDPPVVLSDLTPTCVVIIDKVFTRDECGSENKAVSKYIKKLAGYTDLDVVPVYMNKPFNVPLHPLTAFKYKDHVIDQIMQEFYASRDESASEIMSRVEADREGKAPPPNKWHVFDGISPQGPFGADAQGPPKTQTIDEVVIPRPESEKAKKNRALNAVAQAQSKSWGEQVDDEEAESRAAGGAENNEGGAESGAENESGAESGAESNEEDPDPGEWTEVKKKPKVPAQKRGGARRKFTSRKAVAK